MADLWMLEKEHAERGPVVIENHPVAMTVMRLRR